MSLQITIHRFFTVIFTTFATFVLMFSAKAEDLPDIDYTNPNSWAIYTPASKATKQFDVFFLYPTLYADPDTELLPWNAKTKAKLTHYSNAVLAYFRDNANIYCPYVRQLEFSRYMKYIANPAVNNPQLAVGVEDTERALNYYLTHLNRGRPYIIIGQSQGALDLLLAITDIKNISTEFGFVAAYLPGIPIQKDKESELRLPLGKGETDCGVILSWNTQSPDAVNSPFCGKGVYCINPLNWKTNATAADKKENGGAILIDYKNNTFSRVPEFCGAKIDPEKGALTVDGIPSSTYSFHHLSGIYHHNDLLFFAKNIYDNAVKRVNKSPGK